MCPLINKKQKLATESNSVHSYKICLASITQTHTKNNLHNLASKNSSEKSYLYKYVFKEGFGSTEILR